jgi:hypothetical protein
MFLIKDNVIPDSLKSEISEGLRGLYFEDTKAVNRYGDTLVLNNIELKIK